MSESTPSVPPKIFEHVSRKEWGRSVLITEIADRRTYLFVDGKERSFRPDYWHKMESVDIAGNEAFRIDKLARRNQEPTPGSSRKSYAPPKKPSITFEQQVAYFMTLYPAGFEDDKYIKSERGGSDAEGRLIEASIEEATTALSESNLQAMIDANDFSKVHRIIVDLMGSTKNTTQKSEAARVMNLSTDYHAELARALYALLYGTKNYGLRFDAFVSALPVDGGPSWPMATLLPALVFPQEHIFVKPTFLKKQALILDIDPRYDTSPNATTYARFLEGAIKARELLQVAGQRPRDLFDVYTFISKTLSPKAIKTTSGEDE
ncbi:MAG: hypothetical protein R3A47_09320 [Polyangiales bacterium]